MAEKYLVLGDSFARRTELYCNNHGYVNMILNNCSVDFRGMLGLDKISYIEQANTWLDCNANRLSQYKVAVLAIGSNNLLSYNRFLEPFIIAEELYNLAKKMHNMGIRRVVILELAFRKDMGAIPRWWDNVHDWGKIIRQQEAFNEAVKVCNRHMAWCCKRGEPSIQFERNAGLHICWWNYLGHDGVHYNGEGQRRYYLNMRSVIVQHALSC